MDANIRILAKVGAAVITEADVTAAIASMGQKAQAYNSPEGRRAILEQLVNKQLLIAEAKRNFYEADPSFQAQLAKIKDELLANFAIEKALASVKVDEAEVKQFYEDHKSEMVSGDTVEASHILVDSEAKANEIAADIAAGKITFEDAARQYSSCPSSAEGGSLGEFGRGQMVPEFDAAVFAMNVGDISAPVKTQFGYHLIKLTNRKAAAEIPYEQIKAQLAQQVLADKQQKAYTSKINQLKIMIPVDLY